VLGKEPLRKIIASIFRRRSFSGYLSLSVGNCDKVPQAEEGHMQCFERESAWLRAFCVHYPPETEGDSLVTTFQSAGVVLLMAAALQTDSAILISELTGLPQGFVRVIVRWLDRNGFRCSEQFDDLEETIKRDLHDWKEIRASLEWALDTFWMISDDHTTGGLEAERQCRLVGGSYQTWIDDEELQAFLAGCRKNEEPESEEPDEEDDRKGLSR
jgi:hypothetical protein